MDTSHLHNRASIQTDFSGLDQLRAKAIDKDPQALKVAAQQFEGIYISMMLKSMREANQIFSENSMFNSKEVKFYEEMYDQQLSASLSERSHLGLADMIVRQLSKDKVKPTEREEGFVLPDKLFPQHYPLNNRDNQVGLPLKSDHKAQGIQLYNKINGNR